jgi:carbamoyl-phosphate synthase small subunit
LVKVVIFAQNVKKVTMVTMEKQLAKLILEDGTIFTGTAFGAVGSKGGEVVFNTSMTGYQEILTDPSYAGQIVTMTYPLIGNYGVNSEDVESKKPWISGFVVKELSPIVSNFRSEKSLHEYLAENNILGIEGVDTRAITRKLRIKGAMRGYLTTENLTDAQLLAKVEAEPGMAGQDLVKTVTCEKAYVWDKGFDTDFDFASRKLSSEFNVVAIDCGAKQNILRHLVDSGCKVTVVPATATADEIMSYKPDGLFVSNGPGDPEPVSYVQDTLKELMGKLPMFGICLGHQLLSLALGGKTYKLKFGHRGGNQPVQNCFNGRVEITSQNHGFAVDADSMKDVNVQVTHMNLNDNTVEGFFHNELPVMAVQYHPEASPGPHDASYLFDLFREMMKTNKPPTKDQLELVQV